MAGLARRLGRDPLQRLRSITDCSVWDSTRRPDREALRAALVGQDALLCVLTDQIDAAVMETARGLRVISSISVGVDHIDLDAATQRGIIVTNTPGVLVETTAELAIALLLTVTRRVVEADADVRRGHWTPEARWQIDGYLGKDLAGSTLGLVGLGAIGQAVAARAQAFGLRVLGWSRSGRKVPGVERVSLDRVLAEADFVSLHLASTDETRGLMDASALQSMKPGAILINTARGDLVDELALVDALSAGHLSGAGLDVFAQEPLSQGHPLLTLPSVVLTPHIGSATEGTRIRMVDLAVANLEAALSGQNPLHCANPDVFSR
ncbi:MAG: D-glycerate dehydrogenase [bacterium TMED88]|nr:D-glycerate dehydrogenase [Deltaproteobacteria bacterium]OUV29858.1 MAG: D-glycerate dehydrogenase [bacterium TMED88]